MVLPIVPIITAIAREGVKEAVKQTAKKSVTKTAKKYDVKSQAQKKVSSAKKKATTPIGEQAKKYAGKQIKRTVDKYTGKKYRNQIKKGAKEVQELKKALYKNKNGQYVIKQKAGRTSLKDPFMKAANLYLEQSGAMDIVRLYSQTSRVAHGANGMWGVRMADGSKGWITERGTYISQKDVKDVLHSVDSTSVGQLNGVSLEGLWEDMSPAQKAKFAKEVDEFDWDKFWKEMYPKDGEPDGDVQDELYMELLAKLGVSMDW